ncbi:LEAF RUST 10 DISEASE-RESISTANCE LOCUS RECEPTOR-LIKE PROTEIN KINASE-like 2.4 isoform X2 [Prunus yedoensis var. nudiflora]|uniref:LEAF RUST 10 DISEASE-RESISTANCE LOCUS RECEPTOR-LIKE PROTEIN KINASE-like 2.4 isoform X2 n=1 Tax=Prunus yedoensis var. nudiflora TaxID=2094558 RepID=A0A314UHY2_PRUYE|nr:LEAF RUST 10 DISEASE-RESISTANCE LOCUS RECEPTOR-LIKE PROTEIN KINASE-like 2.4 isoform X2 [Prunus yedoensis var. nudiflora]
MGLSCSLFSCASSCGNIHNISYPFRLNRDPEHCGDSRYMLHCDNNVTVLHLYSGKYLVLALNYDHTTIQVVDPGLEKNNCSSIPRYPLANSNFSQGGLYNSSSQSVTFIKCANPVSSSLYVVTAPCINNLSKTGYVKLGSTAASDLEDGCSIEWTTMMTWILPLLNVAQTYGPHLVRSVIQIMRRNSLAQVIQFRY